MSQNNHFPFVNVTSCNSNDGWANFEAFDQHSESISVTASNNKDDDWADFQSNTEDSASSTNSRNIDQTETIISTCFPLESSESITDTDNAIPSPLPTFTTFKDPRLQLPCFKPSLCLWSVLSNISNDPLGIRYQWHKSNTERLFHRALGVHERKTSPPAISNGDSDLGWKRSDLGNSLMDKTDEDLFKVSKNSDFDAYVPSRSSSSASQSPVSSSPITRRTDSPIKTIGLFPGSTTVLNEDPKPVVNTTPNFSFINPKALMSSKQTTHESGI